jgi:hypothetical protein
MAVNYGTRIVPTILIRNLSKRVLYRNIGRPEWLEQQLNLRPESFQPRPWSPKTVGLYPYPHKLALLKGQDGSLTAKEGLDAWIYSNELGTMRLMVPALNFFEVVQSPVSGLRRVHSNIEVGATNDDSLFEPPPGAVVQQIELGQILAPPAQ